MNPKLNTKTRERLENLITSDLKKLSSSEIMNDKDVRKIITMRIEENILQLHTSPIVQGTIGTALDGYFYTFVKDDSKKDHRRRLKSKTEEGLKKKLVEYYKPLFIVDEYSFETLFNEWLQHKRENPNLAAATINSHFNAYERFIKGTEFANSKVSQITRPILKEFLEASTTKFKLTAKSYGKLRSIIRGVFEFAIDKEIIQISPYTEGILDSKTLFPPKHKKSSEQAYTDSERNQLVQAILNDYKGDLKGKKTAPLGVIFSFMTGLRSGELMALKKKDIDGNILFISRAEVSYNPIDENGNKLPTVHEVTHPKTENGYREIFLVPDALKVLKLIKKVNEANGFTDSEWIFLNEKGERIIRQRINSSIEKYCHRTGLPVKRSHKIRKTVLSNCLNDVASEKAVTEFAGHEDIETTRAYYSFNTQDDPDLQKSFEKAVSFKDIEFPA